MIHIKRENEPLFWSQFRKKNPGIRYSQLYETEEGTDASRQLRSFNISQQHGLCAYCCCRIDPEESLNEHLKPEGRYPQFSMDYENLVACCNKTGVEETCSASKKSQYDEKWFISPLEEDCEDYFEYYPNGEIVSESQKGKYTIEILNLNSYRLREARKARLKACRSYHDPETVRQIFLEPNAENRLEAFIDIVKYCYQKGLL